MYETLSNSQPTNPIAISTKLQQNYTSLIQRYSKWVYYTSRNKRHYVTNQITRRCQQLQELSVIQQQGKHGGVQCRVPCIIAGRGWGTLSRNLGYWQIIAECWENIIQKTQLSAGRIECRRQHLGKEQVSMASWTFVNTQAQTVKVEVNRKQDNNCVLNALCYHSNTYT